jgi:hypothetical protein
MLPGPLLASPPETDQVTLAAPPPVSVAENCSTDAPLALLALQPVQLVSMEPVPGEMEKVEFEGSAVTRPAEHPAASSSAGARSAVSIRIGSLRTDNFPMRDSGGFAQRSEPVFVTCFMRGNGLSAFLGVMN